MRIYTIGHSSLPAERLLELLRQHRIEALVDVRTYPASRHHPQYNGSALRAAVEGCGIAYHFAGRQLGGRPNEAELCSPDGKPDYDKIAATAQYRRGIAALIALADGARVAVLCSEADPAQCHREKLIARTLREREVDVLHIYPDGSAYPAPQPAFRFFERNLAADPLGGAGSMDGAADLFTIGTSGKSLREFVERLRAARVDLVIDIRLRNTSQLAGYSQRDSLEFLLPDLLGIAYRHETSLAPTPALLDGLRGGGEWDEFAAAFARLLQEREMLAVVAAAVGVAARPCLLCACRTPHHCHRRLLAEAVRSQRPHVRLEHLP
jgi:uncharacterized protein (DUF488 family)